MEKAELETKFEKVFGAKPEKTFFSPGRINLIGEHTDFSLRNYAWNVRCSFKA